jgi:hypothetical protein
MTRPRINPQIVKGIRWGAVTAWAVIFGIDSYERGVHFDRTGLLLWLAVGLVAASIGTSKVWYVVIDFLPFAAVLVAYDLLRGAAGRLGMPTWWQPQIDVDKFFFFGTEPTVWLQEHLKSPQVRWWDVVTSGCYYSFFFLPYVAAAIFWLRGREQFYRWAGRFVSLSFAGFGLFALIPAAPPWAAARCTAAQVANHPSNPICMQTSGKGVPNGGLLGAITSHRPGANPWVERWSNHGFGFFHLHAAAQLVSEGQQAVDQVAAVPSLHAGGTMLFVLFVWKRANKWWRPLLVAYPLVMAFSLMYSAEHYFADILAGWLLAALIHFGANRVERWRNARMQPDTLEPEPQQVLPSNPAVETQCQPNDPLPETTPSST